MEIKCTVEEFKELIKNTPVAGTTDVKTNINPIRISETCIEHLAQSFKSNASKPIL